MTRAAGASAAPGTPVPSPCVDVCRIDAASGLCAGCLRTLDEIATWAQSDEAARRAVWQRLRERRARLAVRGPVPATDTDRR